MKRVAFPLLAVILVGISWWIFSVDEIVAPQGISPRGADFYMRNFSSVIMDTNGLPKHKLVAMRMTHFPKDDHTDLTEPTFTIFRPKNTHYIISAKTGMVLGEQQHLYLEGDVNVRRYNKNELLSYMSTQSLWVKPDENLVETEKAVKFVDARGEINAIGARADTHTQRLELLSEVKGHYVPQ